MTYAATTTRIGRRTGVTVTLPSGTYQSMTGLIFSRCETQAAGINETIATDLASFDKAVATSAAGDYSPWKRIAA
ncbi:hypothetical protein [Gemmatimonas sp.]|uniref:hypothetical protein n=1 Tax=Gemmatimonas sp. TaxID=1962908 RepID=UPI003564B6B0